MTALKTVERALALARVRLRKNPEFEIFTSTVAQLEYLLSVLRGDERDRSRLKDIIVGHFAVREFEESDPELAEALNAAQAIAFKAARGLKVYPFPARSPRSQGNCEETKCSPG
ncbi:immunity protein Tsi6 family protein [Zoogloea sp.]|uniref:immunity protein Tsi6 family protein n=1 Tax=Zoogloea sp. TaxID=49181 RepID=UPI002615B455|nr:immunity protein Tsi6 family protein [Zoogloea sp.]